jgi:hypothetical protein
MMKKTGSWKERRQPKLIILSDGNNSSYFSEPDSLSIGMPGMDIYDG